MKYCAHCNKEISDEAVICTNCGVPVKDVSNNRIIESNTYGILCIVFSFCLFPVGLIMSANGLLNKKYSRGNKRFSIIGLIIFVFYALILLTILLVA